jgi:hypothetical protein
MSSCSSCSGSNASKAAYAYTPRQYTPPPQREEIAPQASAPRPPQGQGAQVDRSI